MASSCVGRHQAFLSLLRDLLLSLLCQTRCSVWVVEVTVDGGIKAFSLSQMCKHFCYFVIPLLRCSLPYPAPTTALTCVLRCFPCEPTWAGSPFLHRPPTPPMVRMTRSKTFQAYLPSCHRTYSCIHCRAHLANHDELISKVSVDKVAKCLPLEGCTTLLLISNISLIAWTCSITLLLLLNSVNNKCKSSQFLPQPEVRILWLQRLQPK